MTGNNLIDFFLKAFILYCLFKVIKSVVKIMFRKNKYSNNPYTKNKPYAFPTLELLESSESKHNPDSSIKTSGIKLIKLLKTFGVEASIKRTISGSSVIMYELALSDKVKIKKVQNLVNEIQVALCTKKVRVVPMPENGVVGIEVTKNKKDKVRFVDTVKSLNRGFAIPYVLGKNLTNKPVCIDIAKTPHLLIAGATGSGKSVAINNLICSILYSKTPQELKLALVDPKKVELSVYNGIPHLITPVITDAESTIRLLDWLIYEMNTRYEKLNKSCFRNINSYNNKVEVKLPHILVIIDEFADLMQSNMKEIEPRISRLTAMSRAVGIHLVLATQRPSADVITGIIKSNIPSRISFAVASGINSRIILDESGAEKLGGNGDMLYKEASLGDLQRIQGTYISDDEIERIVNFVKE